MKLRSALVLAALATSVLAATQAQAQKAVPPQGVSATEIQIESDAGQPYTIPMAQWKDHQGSIIVSGIERFLGVQGSGGDHERNENE